MAVVFDHALSRSVVYAVAVAAAAAASWFSTATRPSGGSCLAAYAAGTRSAPQSSAMARRTGAGVVVGCFMAERTYGRPAGANGGYTGQCVLRLAVCRHIAIYIYKGH
jgi:hypothetical protein